MATSPTRSALPLAGKLALVTGASRGIGAEIALELAVRGANVCLCYTSASSTPRVEALAEKIRSLPHGPAAYIIQEDLSTFDGPQQVVSRLQQAAGPDLTIDILVNNAAILMSKPLAELAAEDYDSVFNTNLRGVFRMTQVVLPHLPPYGRIINLSSQASRYAFPNSTLYSATKGALEGFTKSLAAELGGRGVTVNAVAPGPVATDMLDTLGAESIEWQRKQTPLENRVGNVGDIARVVAFLASEDGRWVTGQTILANGGFVMN